MRSSNSWGGVRRKSRAAALAAVMAASVAGISRPAVAQDGVPTRVLVRVLAHDAKLIGSGMGGARVTIREAETGRVLAEGAHEGGTGSTDLIMSPQQRGATVYDTPGAAGFEATLMLDRPTIVEIEAAGPLGIPAALQRASKSTLLVPGEHVLGEGVVLELNGLAVEILESAPRGPPPGTLEVRARVRMVCGCPIEPGGTWDANRMRVVARLLDAGRPVAESELGFAGETSVFTGMIALTGDAGLALEVVALDRERANFGRAVREITVSR